MAGKDLHASLGILVEAFEQGNGKRVLDGQELRPVIDGVTLMVHLVVHVVVLVGIVFGGCGVGQVGTAVVVDVERMDEAGDGNELVLHRGIDGVLAGLNGQQAVALLMAVNDDA